MAPVIEWIRPGVGFTREAAASFRRAEASWGPIRCNSTYRDYDHQLGMWEAWEAYRTGRGPHPGHSRALHPDESMHCRGLAADTDLWTVPGFIGHMAEHGWIRTAAWDPTERHHFEYQSWRDQYRAAPAGGTSTPIAEEWDEMATKEEIKDALREVLAEKARPNADYSLVRLADRPEVFLSVNRETLRWIRNERELELIRYTLRGVGAPAADRPVEVVGDLPPYGTIIGDKPAGY